MRHPRRQPRQLRHTEAVDRVAHDRLPPRVAFQMSDTPNPPSARIPAQPAYSPICNGGLRVTAVGARRGTDPWITISDSVVLPPASNWLGSTQSAAALP